jgi:N-acetylglucosaminyldiphosphoundecaprenol N-acetyl-beta-D-mannosaminyltransferase
LKIELDASPYEIPKRSDDLAREVYGILGIPVDAVDVEEVVRRIGVAMAGDEPFLISTPNLNFLVTAQVDRDFRESLLLSDLCPADGVPIVWISRLLGIPIKARVAGSDIFDRLKFGPKGSVKAFLFGGRHGVAETAEEVLNCESSGVNCVGSIFPGFGEVNEMSSQAIIDVVNGSGAGFLVASLGAQKGQSWLMANHDRLKIPVRAHLGAAINFQARLLKRAPLFIRKSGFEWMWRIKEEPYLWRRYLHDGIVLARLMLGSVLPLALEMIWRRFSSKANLGLSISISDASGRARKACLAGDAVASNIEQIELLLRQAIAEAEELTIDLSKVHSLDARFLGLLLMVRKSMVRKGGRLHLSGVPREIRRAFLLHRFGFLLDGDDRHEVAKVRLAELDVEGCVASSAVSEAF